MVLQAQLLKEAKSLPSLLNLPFSDLLSNVARSLLDAGLTFLLLSVSFRVLVAVLLTRASGQAKGVGGY